jgi:glycosyltransferase involved in cell wall biosynthesis
MAHALARAGHKVIVISRALSERQHYIEANGVEVFRIRPRFDVSSRPVVWRLNRWWEGYRLAVAIQLKQILRKRKIDIIESPELHAEPLLHSVLNSKPPLVVRLHSGSAVVANFEPHHSNGSGHDARLEHWMMGNAAHVTSPSKALLTATPKANFKRSTVIPNPVDTDYFKPLSESVAVASFPNVLCVGRPRFLKGIHILARAIPMVWENASEATFTFIPASMGKSGGSPADAYREFLGQLLDDPRIRIVADPVTRANMPDYYQGATICVVPSLWEGFGYVCAEAMACGVAVVASRTGGLAEIIENERSGVLVEPGNANDLAEAILNLIRDSARRARIGAGARNRIVEEFSSTAIAARMTDLYQQVIHQA